MKIFCAFLPLLVALSFHAQDTIVYRNALKVAVVFKEISPSEIRYQRLDMPDGPDYVVSKSEVDRLIYKNGYTEVILPVPAQSQSEAPAVKPGSLSGGSFAMNYRQVKKQHKLLPQLVLEHPDASRQPALSLLASDIRKSRAVQDGTRTGAIVCGALALAGTLLYGVTYIVSNGSNIPLFYLPPVGLGGIALICGTVSIIYNVRLREKRHEFVNLYNE